MDVTIYLRLGTIVIVPSLNSFRSKNSVYYSEKIEISSFATILIGYKFQIQKRFPPKLYGYVVFFNDLQLFFQVAPQHTFLYRRNFFISFGCYHTFLDCPPTQNKWMR